jgi:hypothetical protein
MKSLLLDAVQASQLKYNHRVLFLSVNPDLKSDFGHYLNYEKRINEACYKINVFHHCLANKQLGDTHPHISPIFDHDSGHYCLYRRSAVNNENSITTELYEIILKWINSHVSFDYFDSVVVFLYMSSTKSAAMLSCMKWPTKVRIVCNSFWDFLSSTSDKIDHNLSRLQMQTDVQLLALSSAYKELIYKDQGIVIDYIPNPPPLASDSHFYDFLRTSYASKNVRSRSRIEILMPSLLTMGKGRDFTSTFLKNCEKTMPSIAFTVRDRNDELRAELSLKNNSSITLLSGDFSDYEIIQLYKKSDIAILPYSSEVFHFRTSGALVDCLMTSTIPIVFPDTWLSAMCTEYGFGVICASESHEDVRAAVLKVVESYSEHLVKMLDGALMYMKNNSWNAFISKILDYGLAESFSAIRGQAKAGCRDKLARPQIHSESRIVDFAKAANEVDEDSRISVRINRQSQILDQLLEANTPQEMKMLITTVSTRLRTHPAETRRMLNSNQKLAKAVERALATLQEDGEYNERFARMLKAFR